MSASTNRIVSAAAQKVCAELLEGRVLMAADPLIASIDGTGHNLAHATWGSAGTDFLRTAQAAYADGVSSPGGTSRPSARVISNAVSAQGDTGTEDDGSAGGNDRAMSAFVYAWGQFVDHDLDLTNTQTQAPVESFNVAVPSGDPSFDPNNTGTQVIPLTRSQYDPATGTSAG